MRFLFFIALWVLAVLRVFFFTTFTLIAITVGIIFRCFSKPMPDFLRKLLYKFSCFITGLKINIVNRQGVTARHGHVFVANHIGYYDILALGSILNGDFIAKAEIRHWPFIGWLAAISGTFFIHRRGSQTLIQNARIHNFLTKKNIILFPEGTTTDGSSLAPFKSSLFELPKETKIIPLSLRYYKHGGKNYHPGEATPVAWVGHESLVPHMFRLLRSPRTYLEITVHDVIVHNHSRKETAQICQSAVARGLAPETPKERIQKCLI